MAAILTAAVLVVGAAPASAHDSLQSSDPAAGENLDAPPERVVLRFGSDPLEMGATVIVADAAGDDRVSAAPTVDGKEVSAPLGDGMGDGYYQIRWRIVSADGAIVSGTVDFSVGDVTGAEPVRLPSSSTPSTPSQASGDFAGLSTGASTTTTTDGVEDTSGRSPLLVGAFGAVAALALALGYQRFAGGRSTPTQPTPTQEQP